MCFNPKSDSKRREHHPGQKMVTRRPQMTSRVSLNWLTEPQGQGAWVFARSLGTWHLKQQPPETARSHPIQYWGREARAAMTILKALEETSQDQRK